MHPREQPEQRERRGQHRLALHDVQRRRHEQRMQHPQARTDQGGAVARARIVAQAPAEDAQEHEEQRAIQQMQHEVRAQEGRRLGGPIARIDQERQQRYRSPGGIGEAGGDVAPEGRRVGDRPVLAQCRQIDQVVEQEPARQPRPISDPGKEQDTGEGQRGQVVLQSERARGHAAPVERRFRRRRILAKPRRLRRRGGSEIRSVTADRRDVLLAERVRAVADPLDAARVDDRREGQVPALDVGVRRAAELHVDNAVGSVEPGT